MIQMGLLAAILRLPLREQRPLGSLGPSRRQTPVGLTGAPDHFDSSSLFCLVDGSAEIRPVCLIIRPACPANSPCLGTGVASTLT